MIMIGTSGEAIVAQLKAWPYHLPGGTTEKCEKSQSIQPVPWPRFEWGTSHLPLS